MLFMSSLPMLDLNEKAPLLADRGPTGILPGILDEPADKLRAWLDARRQPPMRVQQIRRQILANRATSFEEMSDLPKDLRAELAKHFSLFSTRVERHLIASDQ